MLIRIIILEQRFLEYCLETSRGPYDFVRDSMRSKIMCIKILRCYLPFLFSDPPKYAVEFSRGSMTCKDITVLEANGMFACIFCVLTLFSLISKC